MTAEEGPSIEPLNGDPVGIPRSLGDRTTFVADDTRVGRSTSFDPVPSFINVPILVAVCHS